MATQPWNVSALTADFVQGRGSITLTLSGGLTPGSTVTVEFPVSDNKMISGASEAQLKADAKRALLSAANAL